MTNLAISFGGAPYSPGVPTALNPDAMRPANQVTLWPPNRRVQPPRLRLVPGRGITAMEARFIRGYVQGAAQQAFRLSPWGRALIAAMYAYEAYRAFDTPFPEYEELNLPTGSEFADFYGALRPDSAFSASYKIRPNGLWQKHPTTYERSYSFDYTGAPTASSWMQAPASGVILRTDWNLYIGRVLVTTGATVGRYAVYMTGEMSRVPTGSNTVYVGEEARFYLASAALPSPGLYQIPHPQIPSPTLPVTIYPNQTEVMPQVQPLPYWQVGKVNKVRDLISPRPDGRPIRESPSPFIPTPPPAAGGSISLKPGARPVAGPPHQMRPPGRGTKERKAKVLPGVQKLINLVTETNDAIEAVWYALPRHLRTPGANPAQMAMDLYRHYDSIDMNLAVRNLILTNAQDAAIGKLSGPLQREFRKYRPDREFAFYGPV